PGEQSARGYHVDMVQAQRVDARARDLLRQLDAKTLELTPLADFLDWATRLHEIGISIAQGAYHKHSAYILANADMPGFSRQEQGWLSNLVLAQRGKLGKMQAAFADDPRLAAFAYCLRLAVIFHRSRRDLELPAIHVSRKDKEFRLAIDGKWLEEQTLIALALDAERHRWQEAGLGFQMTF